MTVATINYIEKPLSNFWKSVVKTTEIVGYSRAAVELARQGLYKEAKYCMMQVKNLRES